MNEIVSLDKININENCVIEQILLDDNIKKRIYDLGMIENTILIPLYKSPFNDPTAYLVRNTVIAIRNNDAKKIFVRRI